MTTEFIRNNRFLLIILVISFLLSAAYSFYFRIKPAVDARAYDNIAVNIISGNGYREHLTGELSNDYAIARVGPLYEYFLAGFYKVFGHRYGPVWLAQALLRALTAWLVYLTAMAIFADNEKKKTIGLWAAAIIGFFPDLIEISAMLMTETLYLFFVCLMFYLFFRYLYRPANCLAASLGLAAALAVLSRPPVLFLLPVILFFFLSRKKFWPLVLFCLALLLVWTPWTVRNWRVYGEIMPFGAAGSYNFWIGNYHGADGEQTPMAEHYKFIEAHQIKEVNAESAKQFKAFLRDYPAEFIKLTALRVNKYFSIIRPMGWWFYQHGLGQLLFILSSAAAGVVLLILGLSGTVKSIMAQDKKLYYLLAFLIFTPLIIFVTVVETRYRFQVYPLLAIFAGYFIVYLAGRFKWWTDRILLTAVVIIFANGLLDLFLSWGKFMEKLRPFINL